MKKEAWYIGVDEVGRGALAGPVTVCAFASRSEKSLKFLFQDSTIRDSKKISKTTRNIISKTIRKNRLFIYSVKSVSAEQIDKLGITGAVSLCADRCLKDVEKQGVSMSSAFIRLDAGIKIDSCYKKQSRNYIRGDEQYAVIALASVLAKVSRDTYLSKVIHKKYPRYFFDKHVGYGTEAHRKMILKNGILPVHRKSFIKNIK